MTASADDYLWFIEEYPLGLNFCATLVRALTPDEVIAALGGSEAVDITGARRLAGAAEQVGYPHSMGEDGVFHADLDTGLDFIAAGDLGGWTLIVEPNGFRCSTEESAALLSAKGELVSFYFNENTAPVLRWARDGVTLVSFDPCGGAGWREGSEPDRLVPALASLGFDLSTEEIDPADPRWRYDEKWQARALALMEHLTGVPITSDLLESARFRCAAVPDEHALSWMRANPGRIGPLTVEELAVQARGWLTAYAADPDRDGAVAARDRTLVATRRKRPKKTRLEKALKRANPVQEYDRKLPAALGAADTDTLRAVVLWAAERAVAVAGLSVMPWASEALEALRAQRPLPPPFNPKAQYQAEVWELLEQAPVTWTTVRVPGNPPLEMSQQHVALPALIDAGDRDPLVAALNVVFASAVAHGEPAHRAFLAALWKQFPQLQAAKAGPDLRPE
ncbi:DUF6461 domain-containing protein [Actinoplanes missouriensis]|uniref:DUF6461 domain-containing protein n=1 Tax=Actinoplanes missouriensis TaxID=1866 RepID=UPI0012FC8FCF|nr:DUF6461 domain-containing protein [Actinoplanes missouriensis]